MKTKRNLRWLEEINKAASEEIFTSEELERARKLDEIGDDRVAYVQVDKSYVFAESYIDLFRLERNRKILPEWKYRGIFEKIPEGKIMEILYAIRERSVI